MSWLGVVLFVGRILFATFFILGGIGHFTRYKMLTGYAQSLGVPAAGLLVPISGALVAGGGASIALGIWPDLGAVMLIIFLVPVTLWAHPFWKMPPEQRQMQALNFWRNVTLAGSALIVFYLAQQGAFPYALTGPLFGVR